MGSLTIVACLFAVWFALGLVEIATCGNVLGRVWAVVRLTVIFVAGCIVALVWLL